MFCYQFIKILLILVVFVCQNVKADEFCLYEFSLCDKLYYFCLHFKNSCFVADTEYFCSPNAPVQVIKKIEAQRGQIPREVSLEYPKQLSHFTRIKLMHEEFFFQCQERDVKLISVINADVINADVINADDRVNLKRGWPVFEVEAGVPLYNRHIVSLDTKQLYFHGEQIHLDDCEKKLIGVLSAQMRTLQQLNIIKVIFAQSDKELFTPIFINKEGEAKVQCAKSGLLSQVDFSSGDQGASLGFGGRELLLPLGLQSIPDGTDGIGQSNVDSGSKQRLWTSPDVLDENIIRPTHHSASALGDGASSHRNRANTHDYSNTFSAHGIHRHVSDTQHFQMAQPAVAPRASECPYDLPLANICISTQEELLRSLDLNNEEHRLKTFESLSVSANDMPLAADMARDGWFYLGNLDRTQCFSCGGILRGWSRLENPNVVHCSEFPNCLMANRKEGRNIPMGCHQRGGGIPTTLTAQKRSELKLMFPCAHPFKPHMQQEKDRSRTYSHWGYTRATVGQIVEAGFYALGERDRVKCFYCGGGLRDWKRDDDPWEEHAKWYPTCQFLLQNKGPEFVGLVVAQHPNLSRPMLPAQAITEQLVPVATLPPVLHYNESVLPPNARPDVSNEVIQRVIAMGFAFDQVRSVYDKGISNGRNYTSDELASAVLDDQEVLAAQPPVGNIQDLTTTSVLTGHLSQTGHRDNGDEYIGTVVSFGYDPNMVQSVFSQQEDGYESSASLLEAVQTHVSKQEVADIRESLPSSSIERSSARNSCSHKFEREYRVDKRSEVEKRGENIEENPQITLDQVKRDRWCKSCSNKRAANVIFMPCGHMCCCSDCASMQNNICPKCRQPFSSMSPPIIWLQDFNWISREKS